MSVRRACALALTLLLPAASCGHDEPDRTAGATTPAAAARWETVGDAARGRASFASYECGRCHVRADAPLVESERDCGGCHRAIRDGSYERDGVTAEMTARFRAHVRHLVEVPSLDHVDGWLSRDWIAAYLLEPHDLRPNLEETMPRLAIGPRDAADLATYLVPSPPSEARRSVSSSAEARERGRAAGERLGCPSCHGFGDLWPAPPDGPAAAPDLVDVRMRLDRWAVARFLLDPRAVRPTSSMPELVRDRATADDLVALLYDSEVGARAPAPSRVRLPLLDRTVSFAEVEERVLRRSCWHCHADESLAYGDGGPGNTGGFGFAPREVDLSSYTHVLAGGLDERGERASIFRDVEGEPLLVRVLLARADEERGVVDAAVRGMPLGLPALSPDAIQLVESWIAQGRPR